MTAAPTRVLIVHGYSAHTGAHWFTWLTAALGERGIEATVVELPDSLSPTEAAWTSAVADALGTPDEHTWIVAHSLGAITALRALATTDAATRLGGLVLVSGFTGPLEALPGSAPRQSWCQAAGTSSTGRASPSCRRCCG